MIYLISHILCKANNERGKNMRVNLYKLLNDEAGLPVLVREPGKNWSNASDSGLHAPEVIAAMLHDCFSMEDLAEEHVYVIALNKKWKLLGVSEVSHGTVDSSWLPSRGILMRAVLLGASQIVVAHNHPSGDPEPSLVDITAINNLAAACKLMEIPLVDSIIIGRQGHCSMRKMKLMKEWEA